MNSLILLIDKILNLVIWIVVIHLDRGDRQAVLSWLIAFDVINFRNRFVFGVHQALGRLTEPMLRPIRRILPDTGTIDISPVILILAVWFVRSLLVELTMG